MITRLLAVGFLALRLATACDDQRPPGQSFRFSPEVRMNYEVHGSGERTILLLHGLGASLDTWRDILPVFERQGRVYMVDLIGYGHSTKPARFEYSAQAEADVLSAFVRQLESEGRSRFTVVGHSFGGSVALQLATRRSLEQLILIDAMVSFDSVKLHALVSSVNKWPFNRMALAAVPPKQRAWIGLRRAFRHNSQVDDERVCRYSQFFDMPGGNRAFLQTVKALRLSKTNKAFAAISCPVLVIWGDKDPFLPVSVGEHLVKLLPNARLVVIDNCGHVPHEEWPDETAAALVTPLWRTL